VEVSEETLELDGKRYLLRFLSRPFREGLEVVVQGPEGEPFRISEQGLGKLAVIERVKAEIRRRQGNET
jgi:hypothetical protein